MPKYNIPNTQLPCVTSHPHSRLLSLRTTLICIFFSTSIILYVTINIIYLPLLAPPTLTTSQTYYLVYTLSPDATPNNIHEQAKNIKMRGGAGNIIDCSPTPIIALHAYPDYQKSLDVVQSLAQQGITAYSIALHTTQYDISTYTTSTQDNIISNLAFITQLLSTLYLVINQFDTLDITQNKLYTNIYRLKLDCDLELSSLTTLPNFQTNPIYNQMLDITSILHSLCNRDFNGYDLANISCEFKYSYIAILLSMCPPLDLNTQNLTT